MYILIYNTLFLICIRAPGRPTHKDCVFACLFFFQDVLCLKVVFCLRARKGQTRANMRWDEGCERGGL